MVELVTVGVICSTLVVLTILVAPLVGDWLRTRQPHPFTDAPICFALLVIDPTAPSTIRYWIDERVSRGYNRLDDPLIVLAESVAQDVERRQKAQ